MYSFDKYMVGYKVGSGNSSQLLECPALDSVLPTPSGEEYVTLQLKMSGGKVYKIIQGKLPLDHSATTDMCPQMWCKSNKKRLHKMAGDKNEVASQKKDI